mgnify:CR=1 FL=1
MGFMDSLKRITKNEEEQIELPMEEDEQPVEKVYVRVENLGGVNDVERIEKFLKSGNILLLKVNDLQKKDLGQFKQTVQMVKRRCMQFGWDIVGMDEGYIVLTPKFAKIMR